MALIKVADTKDIPEGDCIAVNCGNERIAVFCLDGKYFAISDTCPHAGGPLSQGYIDGNEVICPWHGWAFALCDAEEAPSDGVRRYKVCVEDGEVKVELPD